MGIFASISGSSSSTMLEELIRFAEIGDVPGLVQMLQCALPINCNGKNGRCALCASVSLQQSETFDVIVNIDGVDFNKKCIPSGCTALMIAAQLNLVDMMEKLLTIGTSCKIDAIDDDYSWTALHFASYNKHGKAVQLLLGHQCNLLALDTFGQTALHIACYNDCIEVVKILLHANIVDIEAFIDIIDKDGNKAIDYAESDTVRDLILLVATRHHQQQEQEQEQQALLAVDAVSSELLLTV